MEMSVRAEVAVGALERKLAANDGRKLDSVNATGRNELRVSTVVLSHSTMDGIVQSRY